MTISKPTSVVLIDGSFLCYYYIFGGGTENPTFDKCVNGFLSYLKYCASQNMVCFVIWDGMAKWRYDLNPEYKSSRLKNIKLLPARTLIKEQVEPFLVQALQYLPVIQLRHPGAEADDVANYVVSKLKTQPIMLATGDWDWAQLISSNVFWHNIRQKKTFSLDNFNTNNKGYNQPDDVWKVKVLEGDISDDIGGFSNIGVKRAIYLLKKYNGLDGLKHVLSNNVEKFMESKVFSDLKKQGAVDLINRNIQLVNLTQGPLLNSSDIITNQGTLNGQALSDALRSKNLNLNVLILTNSFNNSASQKNEIALARILK